MSFQPASAPLCWEQGTPPFSWSGAFWQKKERAREKQPGRKRGSERGSELFWGGGGGVHHSLCCETVPLFGSAMPTARRKASRRAPSIGCHSEERAILHNANLILFSGRNIFINSRAAYIEVKIPSLKKKSTAFGLYGHWRFWSCDSASKLNYTVKPDTEWFNSTLFPFDWIAVAPLQVTSRREHDILNNDS